MISDILCEALTDMEPYLAKEPHCLYGEGETAMIQALQAHMKFVLRYLDTPPEQSVNRAA